MRARSQRSGRSRGTGCAMSREVIIWSTGLAAAVLLAVTLVMLRTLKPLSPRRRVACLVCPVSQLALTWFVHAVAYERLIDDVAALAVAACTVACAVLDVTLMRTIVESEGAEVVSEEARVMESVLAAQRRQAASLAQAHDAATDMRADTAALLAEVADALDAEDETRARELLGAGERSVRTPADAACAHPAVAALLSAKADLCAERGVRWDSYVSLPARLEVSSVALCMVFSNLIDNALAGAVASDVPEPFVRVRAHVAHGLLAVCVENPCGTEASARGTAVAGEVLPKHGWGQRIVASVVADHNGDFRSGEKNGVWRADAILQLGEERPRA